MENILENIDSIKQKIGDGVYLQLMNDLKIIHDKLKMGKEIVMYQHTVVCEMEYLLLNSQPNKILKQLCKLFAIKGYSNMRKEDMIMLIHMECDPTVLSKILPVYIYGNMPYS